jgi:hypothetical protein
VAAPVGNQNARKAKLFEQAIKRALARATGESVDAGLDRGADQLVKAFIEGEQWAIKEVADRLDGKPAQTIGGDPENPLEVIQRIERNLVRSNLKD